MVRQHQYGEDDLAIEQSLIVFSTLTKGGNTKRSPGASAAGLIR
jgi:hypothetical protein